MHGNVYEWCHDWYGKYPTGLAVDPVGPAVGSERVFRGACYLNYAGNCRITNRRKHAPDLRVSTVGARIALSCP